MTDRSDFKFLDGIGFYLGKERRIKGGGLYKYLYLFKDGKRVGWAKFIYYKNVDLVSVTNLRIFQPFRNKGLSKELIQGVNSYLDYLQKEGFLYSMIYEEGKKEIYSKNHWVRENGTTLNSYRYQPVKISYK